MSRFKEISALRKAGQLQEALAEAQAWLAAEPENIWAKRAISWVYYGYLKEHVEDGNYNEVCIQLDNIERLQLPEDEEMVLSSIAYSLGKFFFKLAKQDEGNKSYSLFQKIKPHSFPKPSEAYSVLLKAMHKAFKEAPHYKEVIGWWGIENLRPTDFRKGEYNGKRTMALGEQVLIAYAKALLPSKADVAFSHDVDTESIQKLIAFLKVKTEKCPELTFLPYFEAKLMLAAHQEGDALKAVLPFVRRKQGEFWAWQVLAETLEEDPDAQIACYAKALQCRADDGFLVNIRVKLAERLIEKEQFAEAKYEIGRAVEARHGKGWRIPKKLQDWQQTNWYRDAQEVESNKILYAQYADLADELLFQDIPPQTGIITFVNRQKRMSGFMVSKSVSGVFQWRQLQGKATIGQTIALRLVERQGKEGVWYQVVGVKVVDAKPPKTLVRKFSGELYKRPEWEFGLVDGVFVPPQLIRKHQLSTGDQVAGSAMISYDKKKSEWGLAAFELGTAAAPKRSSDSEPGEALGGYF